MTESEEFCKPSGQHCKHCGKELLEYFFTKESMDDPSVKGWVEMCDCQEAQEEQQAAEEEERQKAETKKWETLQDDIERRLTKAGIYKKYMRCTTPSMYLPKEPSVMNAVREFIKSGSTGETCENPWLYIYGTYGSGKTSLACSILYHIITKASKAFAKTRRLPVCIFTTPNMMMRDIQSTFDSNEDDPEKAFRRYADADVLVLDDFAKLSMSDYRADTFFDLLNERDGEERLTIFTSNCEPGEELIRQLTTKGGNSDNARAIESRIYGNSLFIRLTNTDHRKQ